MALDKPFEQSNFRKSLEDISLYVRSYQEGEIEQFYLQLLQLGAVGLDAREYPIYQEVLQKYWQSNKEGILNSVYDGGLGAALTDTLEALSKYKEGILKNFEDLDMKVCDLLENS